MPPADFLGTMTITLLLLTVAILAFYNCRARKSALTQDKRILPLIKPGSSPTKQQALESISEQDVNQEEQSSME